MLLSDKQYEILKWVITIFSPALATLIGGLGLLFNYPNTDVVVTVIALVTAFLGSIFKISADKYYEEEEE